MGLSAIKLIMSRVHFMCISTIFLLPLHLGGKNNDDVRRIIQRKSNHCDDPAEKMRTEYHLGALNHRERQHRKYTKQASEYWEEFIKTKRGEKKRDQLTGIRSHMWS